MPLFLQFCHFLDASRVDYQFKGNFFVIFWKIKGTTISFWNFLTFISLLSDKISSMAGWHSRSRSRHWSGNRLRCRNQSTQFTLSRQYHVQSQGWKGTCWYLGKAKKCHIHLAAPLLHYWKQSKVCTYNLHITKAKLFQEATFFIVMFTYLK